MFLFCNCFVLSKCDSVESLYLFVFCVMILIENLFGMYLVFIGSNVRNVDYASSVGSCVASFCYFFIILVMDFSIVVFKKLCVFRFFLEN